MRRTLDLPVSGMDCATCASHVKSALEGLDGVDAADVRLAAEKAVVEYDDDRVGFEALSRAVGTAGYAVDASRLPAELRERPESAAEVRAAEARGFTRRAIGVMGLVFGTVLLVVVLGEWLGLFEAATERVPFAVGAVLVALVGWPAFRGVIRAALQRRVISHTLMTVGVVAALLIGQWVTAAVVAFFMRVGDFVEGFTMDRGRRALRELESMAPTTARVEREGVAEEVPVAAVRPGDIVVVRPGERVPVDGRVVEGSAAVEQAAITGESMPVDVGPGDDVFAATIARGGALRVVVDRVGDDATFGRIVRMVEDAEAEKGRVESFADRFSGWYLPVVAVIALATYLIRGDVLATAAVLVVACSCAFAIATPVAMLASIGAAARKGLLIKGGAYIEALARADVILVDKTGTFTVGRPAVAEVVSLQGSELDDGEIDGGRAGGRRGDGGGDAEAGPDAVVRLAASVERDSEHPLAEAIRAEARRRRLTVPVPARFEAMEGAGVAADVEGSRVVVGSDRVLAGPVRSQRVERLRGAGLTIAWVVRDGEPVGAIGIGDEVREDVPAALAELRGMGLERIELLTGDHEAAAAPVAAALGVDYRAGLLPEDKIRIVREYQERGHTVVMIGDGVNDAPALAQADVGIAMGAAGTDLALEVAHVALMRDDWSLVPEAFRTARRTMGVVKGNFGFTGVYNVVGLTLAALGFLPPIVAAAAQSIPDLGILGNSARLLRDRPAPGSAPVGGTGIPPSQPGVPATEAGSAP